MPSSRWSTTTGRSLANTPTGRSTAGDSRPGQVPYPRHAAAVGSGGHRRLPSAIALPGAVEVEGHRAGRIGAELPGARHLRQLLGAGRNPQLGRRDALAVLAVVNQHDAPVLAADRACDVFDADKQRTLVR